MKKLNNNEYDAIILSKAGVDRLGLSNLITERLDHSNFFYPQHVKELLVFKLKRNLKLARYLKL